MNKKCVLVDGSSYLFRAYHALPPLMTSKGMPTGAMYGVLNMLRKLIKEEKPDLMAVIFDTKSKNFRHELYPDYKANRPEMAEDLSVQIAPLHETIVAMGLPLIAVEGVEADDVIATLCHAASDAKMETVVSTGDKDLAQLVDEHITLVNTMTGNTLDIQGVIEKFGVRPDQIVDYLTLVGDPVDNVPGVEKVGPKTAAKWMVQYETLDNLIKHAQEVKGKVGENLRKALSTLPLAKKLVTVDRNVKLPFQLEELIIKPQNQQKLKNIFTEMEFKSWLKELEKLEQSGLVVEQVETPSDRLSQKHGCYETIFSESNFLSFLNKIKKSGHVVISAKTNQANPLQAEIIGLSLAIDPMHAVYIPLAHDYLGVPEQLNREWVLSQLKPLLEDSSIKKIGINVKHEMHVLARYGIFLQGIASDPMLGSYVLNSTAGGHDIDALAHKYLDYKTFSFEDLAGKGAKQLPLAQIEVSKACEYAAEDADITLRLEAAIHQALEKEPTLKKVYEEIELPLIEVLWQMEEHGIGVDVKMLEKQSVEITEKLQQLEKQASILAGREFNLGSPKQLQEIFYEELKLPILERTPTGMPSTAENVLQDLSLNYELPRIVLEHRTLSKLKSTYTDKLPLQINQKTQRIHTSYHQAVTATGRLSSTDPNLQNIPIRTEEGRRVRQAFIPQEGYILLAADYSQIELRIMAHLSGDSGLLKAFQAGEDIHRFTASEIFNVPLEEVSAEQRRSAKAINFGLIYGMSAFGLARQLNIERAAAQSYMELYFKRYPKVKEYMESARLKAFELGYVETIFGRRLYLPDIRSKSFGRKRAAERAAINAPMQGTGADIIKRAMIHLHEKLKGQAEMRMLMQVHDELVFEVKPDSEAKARLLIQTTMQNAAKLAVPLVVDVGVGKNWDEAH